MKREVISANNELAAARQQFENWRKTHKKGSRIPEVLWNTAVELVASHSVHEVSKVLRLEYNYLKRRVAQKNSPHPSKDCRFIELDLSPNQTAPECVIEMQRPDGAQMRVQIKGALDSALLNMVEAFWGRS